MVWRLAVALPVVFVLGLLVWLSVVEREGDKATVAREAIPNRAARSDPRVRSVLIVRCADGWSEVVDIKPGYGRMTWSWRVKGQYLFEGRWRDHKPTTIVDGEGFRYCHDGELAGRVMPVYWSKIP